MKRLTIFFTVILLSFAIANCGGGGGGGGDNSGTGTTPTGGGGGGGTGGGTTPPPPGPTFAGFDFAFAAGNFWEFKWDYYDNSWAQGSTPSTVTDTGQFWVVLGQAAQIQGVTSYEVLTYGKSRIRESTGTRSFGPRWKYVALSENKIYGSTDGAALTMIFDAATGKWPGGGFFTTLPGSTLNIAQNGTISTYNTYVSGTAIVAQRSGSQSECEYYPGVGSICGDSSYNYNEEEYYRAAIGPVGYYYYNSFSDCGGGFCSGATWRHNAGLAGSTFTGQTNPLVDETEPNDSPATAKPITTANPIIGTVSQSALANQGNTVITVTVVPDGGSSTSYSPTVEDWYSFTLASPRTVTITLSFEGRSDADLDLFLMNSAGSALAASNSYSIHDNVARSDQHEVIKVVNLAAGTYRIGVDGYLTPTTAVQYTLQLE